MYVIEPVSFIMINDDINPINLSVSFGGIFIHDNL